MMNRIGNTAGNGSRFLGLVLSVTAILAVGCTGHVDLGGAVSRPDPISDDRELASQTTNLAKVKAPLVSSLAIDENFLYFIAGGAPAQPLPLWRCRKSDCWDTLTIVASHYGDRASSHHLSLNAGRLGSAGLLCDAPGCENRIGGPFEIWDESFGYWFDRDLGFIYRCELADCRTGTVAHPLLKRTLVASRAEPRDFNLADEQLYWVDGIEGTMRTKVDGSTPAERLTLGNVTAWTSSRAGLQLAGDVTVIDIELDGPYIYAALRFRNQNANQVLGCDSCAPGIAVARWQRSAAGAPREWVLMNDADVTDLIHLRVFGGEVIWGTANGNLWSCVADHCSVSKRQIGVDDATSKVIPKTIALPSVEWQFVAVDEQAIFWLSVPCDPEVLECSQSWTLKRTPRIAL